MCLHKTFVWLSVLTVWCVATVAGPSLQASPTPREILGSELLVKEYLDNLDVPAGQTQPLQENLLLQAFPNYLFFVVAYPPAAAPSLPDPLKAVNVFAVAPSGKVLLLNGPEEIVALFKAAYDPGLAVHCCHVPVRIALLLLKARYPGYQFSLPEEEIRITTDPVAGKVGVGKLVVTEGVRHH